MSAAGARNESTNSRAEPLRGDAGAMSGAEAMSAAGAMDAAGRRIDLVFPRFKLLSGAERAILGLAGALAAAGHAPRIVCHRFDDSCRPRLADGVELVTSGARLDWSRNRYLNAVSDYARTLRLGRLLDPQADARVFFGPALLLAWWNLRRSRRARIPAIYYCWEPPRVLYQDRDAVLARLGWLRFPMAAALAAYRRLDRRMVAAVDAVVTSSPFAARRIDGCYGRPAAVITLGIDRERLDAASPSETGVSSIPSDAADSRSPSAPTGDAPSRAPDAPAAERSAESPATRLETPSTSVPRLLTVNYLHPRKRVDLVIEALAELAGRAGVGDVRLTIVGDGPERESLAGLAGRLGVADRVEFAGFVPETELPRHYWAAACYVHATRDESFGLSVIEASYCRRPIVAVAEGGVNDTVDDGVTGYLVAGTPVALADGMERVLAAPDRGARLGAAGRAKIAAGFRWSRGAKDLLDAAQRVEGAWSGNA